MKPFSSIRWRLAAAYAVFAFVTLALLSLWFWYRLDRNLDHQMDRFIDDEMREMEALLFKGDAEFRADVLADEDAHMRVPLYVELRDGGGHSLVRTENLGDGHLPFEPSALDRAGGDDHVTSEARIAGEQVRVRLTRYSVPDGRVRYLQLGLAERDAAETRREFLAQSGALALPLALLILMGAWIAARRATRPIAAMADVAARIRAENLGERIPLSGTGDELDQLAGTLNETLSRLEESFRRVRDFSASASHQLKTPLTVIRGEAELLLRERPDDATAEKLAVIIDESARLTHIVEQLLLLARVDSEQVDVRTRPVDLRGIVERGLRRVEPYVTVRKLAVAASLDGSAVAGSESLLETAVQNLLDNAAKFSPDGGRLLVRLADAGDSVMLEIEDDGPGIPPAERAAVMERFYRRSQRPGAGVGLGLAVAREIALLHGGKLEALDPLEGKGVRFRLEIPRARA